jgi:hypothetical protein
MSYLPPVALNMDAQALRSRLEDMEGRPEELEELLKTAFRLACRQTNEIFMWVSQENDLFTVAIAAVHTLVGEEDKHRLEHELKVLRSLNAAAEGLPIDFSQLADGPEPIGLQKLWKRIKREPVVERGEKELEDG